MSASHSRPRLALIAGPTASGKSALALALAEREGGTIINADASQVYRDLRVLSARPDAAEEARVPHRLYGYRDGATACSAADWAADAREAIADTVADGRLPILVGGTGLYLLTLIEGIAPVPPIDPAIREGVRALAGADARTALEREDPRAAARLHPNDSGRNARALEVWRGTGRSVLDWREERVGGIGRTISLDVTVVDPPLDRLYAACDARFDAMLAAGAVEEVEALVARGLDPHLPVMRAIGVPPLADMLAGRIDRATAAARARQATRNYAKRQRTWFRHQPPEQWMVRRVEGPLYVADEGK